MKLITMTGVVPATSKLPKFSDLFPALISPEKIKVYDGFDTHPAGALIGRVPPVTALGGAAWQSVNSANGVVTPGSDGGYVTGTAGHHVLNLGRTTYDLFATIRKRTDVASGFIGMTLRINPATQERVTFFLDLNSATQNYQIGTNAGSGAGTVTVVNQPISPVPVNDSVLVLRASVTPTNVKCYLNGGLVADLAAAQAGDQGYAGLFFSSAGANRVLDFAAGW